MDNGVTIPKWFIYFVSWTIGIGIPTCGLWGTWVSKSLWTIDAKIATQKDIDETLLMLSEQMNDHLTNPNIHTSALGPIRLRLERLERQVEKLQSRD